MRRQRADFFLETIALVTYIVTLSIVSIFHEPWFDEAQAWLIARDNNIVDIVWHVLHYEGHTPLWYFFLYIPAHLGVPYEFGLKFINIVFASLAAFMLVKKSPFPLAVRLLLPFTYFTFYQYGVISRSYSLLFFILCLTAAAFPSRNRRPVRFALLLALLGGVTAHGILIAFGIAVSWFIEIFRQQLGTACNYNKIPRLIAKDRRFGSLLLLALVNISYIAILWPMPDKVTPLEGADLNLYGLLFKFFIAPLNSVISDVWPGIYPCSMLTVVCLFFAGSILTVYFFKWAADRGIFLYVALPYIFTTLFMILVYFSLNHSGIFALMFIFFIWIGLYNDKPFEKTSRAAQTNMLLPKITTNPVFAKKSLTVCISVVLLVQIYWSVSASIIDIKQPYSTARSLAAFIRDNGISGAKIFNCYSIDDGKILYSQQNIAPLPYFSKNIFYDQNYGKEKMAFVQHKKFDEEQLLKYLKNTGKPDFVIEYRSPISMYSNILTPADYVAVAIFKNTYVWKNRTKPESCRLYIRRDLLPQFPQLKPVGMD